MDLVPRKFQSLSPIKSPPLQPSPHASFPIIAVAIIGILATAFLLVSYYVFVIKCCLNWHRIDLLRRFSFSRAQPAEDPLMSYSPAVVENRGLGEAAIRSIPLFKFKKPDDGVSGARDCECAVCLSEFQQDEKLRVIPNCGHVFHIDCIDVWLQSNANCPLCRTSISAARPDIRFPVDQVLAPSSSTDQDPNPDNDDIEYVVIEIGTESQQANPRIPERLDSNEPFTINPSLRKNTETKISRKKAKKLSHIAASKGDECIDNREKDEQFIVQPIRRSFSMDSAADSQLYLAVQEIILQVNNEVVSPIEGCSSSSSSSNNRVKRSFFSFGQGRASNSRNAVQVQPLELHS